VCGGIADEKPKGQDSCVAEANACHQKSYAQNLHNGGWKQGSKDCKLVALPKWRNSSVIQSQIEAYFATEWRAT
jgi:hypothetical protein